MNPPDQRAFEADLQEADFRIGVAKGLWDLADKDVVAEDLKWPKVVLWITAAERANSPGRFYLLLDCTGYRGVRPTGTFWDPETKTVLAIHKRPKGKPGSRVAQVFRTDWPPSNPGGAFYHPYDREAIKGHDNWAAQHPHLLWDGRRTIADYLAEFYVLLNSDDYIGIG